MIRMRHGLAAGFLALGAAALLAPILASAQGVANMGTLTCMATPGEKETLGPDQQLSCTFEPLTGAKANLVGMVKRASAENESDARVVLVWSVVGPKVDTSVKQLEGTYRGVTSGDSNTGLVGGAEGDIALKPLTPDAALGETAAVPVLELQLAAIKA